jgi:hypothetical protein
MGPEGGSEQVQSIKVEDGAEINRPKTLYRGFIPQPTETNQTTNSEVLKEVIDKGLNPHELEYANKFTWATPNKEYAKGVVTMRFLVRMSTDDEFNSEVRSGNDDLLPSLTSYTIKPETKLYDAQGSKIVPLSDQPTRQLIIDNIQPEDSVSERIDEQGKSQLLEILDSPVTNATIDTVDRFTMRINTMTNSNFLKDNRENIVNTQMRDVIRLASDYYVSKGLTKEATEELLAKEMFGGAMDLRQVAKTVNFSNQNS